MKKRSLPTQIIACFFCISFVLPPQVFSRTYSVHRATHSSPSTPSSVKTFYKFASSSEVYQQLAEDDPYVQFYLSEEIQDIAKQNIPEIAPDSPLVDSDPFFMRSQSWTVDSDGTTRWNLSAPLKRVFESNDFYLYAAVPGSKLFDRLSDSSVPENKPYGLFFVMKPELFERQKTHSPVPVHFFPLPNMNWHSTLPWALENSGANQVTLADSEGKMLPIEYEDIYTQLQISRFNLTLASPSSQFDVLPTIGKTAGFGSRLILEQDPPQDSGPSNLSEEQVKELEAARARMKSNLARVGVILGSTLTAAIVLKYTILKKRFEILDPETPTNVVKKSLKELRQIGDVFVHNLNTISGVPSIWTSNIVETLVDKYFTKLGAAENSLVRRFLNWGVFYSRNTAQKMPLNTKTLLFGAGILGGIDTAFVYVQLDRVVPWVGETIGEAIPSQSELAKEVFGGHNATTRTLIDFEVIRNISGYATSGAATFTRELQDIYEIPVHRMAVDELRRAGLDPLAPENASKLADLKEKFLNKLLIDKGLPSKERFLFDAGTLYQKITTLFSGLTDPRDDSTKYQNLTSTHIKPDDNYWLAKRPGLLLPAVKRARDRAVELAKSFPQDKAAQESAELLSSLAKRLSFLETYIKNPIKMLLGIGQNRSSAREVTATLGQVRKELMLLSYEGTYTEMYKDGARYLPASWINSFNLDGAQMSGQLFRRSLMSLMTGNEALIRSNDKDFRLHSVGAIESARKQLALNHSVEFEVIKSELTNPSDSGVISILEKRYPAEFEILHHDAVLVASELYKEQTAEFKAPKLGFFEQGQVAKARKMLDPKTPYNDSIHQMADNLVKIFGLHMDFVSLPDGTEDRINSESQKQLEKKLSETKLSNYLNSLSRENSRDLKAFWLADFKIKEYMRLMHDPDFAPGQSPARPGRLQKFRQIEWVRGSRVLTAAARSAEAFFSTDSYGSGLWEKVYRVVPFAYDYKMTAQRISRRLIMLFTAGYAFNYYVFGLTMSYSQLAWWLGTSFPFLFAVNPMFMRLFSNLGWKPMGKMRQMFFYATAWSWVSFFGSIPQYMYQGWFDQQVNSLSEFTSQSLSSLRQTGANCLINLGKMLGN